MLPGIEQTILFGFELGRQKSRQRRRSDNGRRYRLADGSAVRPDDRCECDLLSVQCRRLMSSDDFDRRMHADQFHQGRGQRRCGRRVRGQAVADVRDRRRPPLRPSSNWTSPTATMGWNLWSDRHLWSPRLGTVFKPLKSCRSTPATRAPTCRNRATSSAASI